MKHEKPERDNTEIIPSTPGSSMTTRKMPELIERDFDSIFEDLWRSFHFMMRPYFPVEVPVKRFGMLPARHPPLDFIDGGNHYLIHIELPGFTKDDIDARITQEGVTIRAKKETKKEDEKTNYLHRERSYFSFERSIAFPQEVDPTKADGTMKEGILELKVMKKEIKPEEKPQKIELH